MAEWLLVETYGGPRSPSIVAVGSSPRRMVPLSTLLARGKSRTIVEAAVTRAQDTKQPLDVTTDGRRVLARPLISYRGDVHGVQVWTGAADETPPERPVAGAWHFDLTADTIGGSDDLLDLYGVAPENRRNTRHTAEAFQRLITNTDVAKAMAAIVRSEPGTEHHATWTVIRDDGAHRAAHFTLRGIREDQPDGPHVVLRGITQDLGPADSTPTAPPPAVLERRILEATVTPGIYRVLVNHATMRILRWIDPPPTQVAWEYNPNDERPLIHPDDAQAAQALSAQLADARAEGQLRLRGSDGEWIPCQITAYLVALDQFTTAALFELRL